MHQRKNTGTSEMKAFGQELLDLSARYMKAGKAWLNHRREEMTNEHGQGDNRGQNHRDQQTGQKNRKPWEQGRNEQSGQEQYGQYRGSDYDDPRASGESDFSSGQQSHRQGDTTEQRYAGYSESGGYRAQNPYAQNQQRHGASRHDLDFMSMGGQSRNTGGHGGYADEQGGRGQNDHVSRRNAQEQYGDPRGQGGSAQGSYGQSSQAGSGQQGGYGQSGGQTGDQGSMNSHRGKGPRSYTRSDERVTEDVNEQLMHADDIDASDIEVRVQNGEVTLEGTVPERGMKHRAEDVVERCSGVKDVDNRIRVKKPGTGGQTESHGVSASKASPLKSPPIESSTIGSGDEIGTASANGSTAGTGGSSGGGIAAGGASSD